jgi:hypothetical protein
VASTAPLAVLTAVTVPGSVSFATYRVPPFGVMTIASGKGPTVKAVPVTVFVAVSMAETSGGLSPAFNTKAVSTPWTSPMAIPTGLLPTGM